ncbi:MULTISPECIES: phosphodiester glycosidase family protein [unclassified Roseofilum]|uniref:phosphodiester glycosidase family protein n=1 Tax=unclassified Roseofilum TaxID=2620099 RepID=UPI001B15BF9F|nr:MULTISPECIES: phosphodiester glycosidase family protein [unclassified Roseofilum]MBP0011417.1 phosphodiester glycosidase family protein [Roseofilum sp. Belize Diploria]MBP0035952.1 phosphodiester glycosidase family protein [Roseofilum sp. Belize BBD 4]
MSSFPDTLNHWAFPFIQALRDRRIVNGFPDGTFRPDRPMTRAEYAVILQAALQQPQKRPYTPFIDVGANFWATQAIIWAYETNFISGFPGRRFRPQANVTRIQIIVSLVSGLRVHTLVDRNQPLAPLEDIYEDASSVPQYGRDALHLATRANLVVNYPDLMVFHPNQDATRAEVAAFFYQSLLLLGKVEAIPSDYILQVFPAGPIREGTRISINGKTRAATWNQWSNGLLARTAIADAGLIQGMGIDLLNTENPSQQPVQWFSLPIALPVQRHNHYRHLEITNWRKQQSLTMSVNGDTLAIAKPMTNVTGIQIENLFEGDRAIGLRLKINLTEPTPYQLRQDTFDWQVTLDAAIKQSILDDYQNPSTVTPESTRPSSEEVNEGEVIADTSQPLRPTITADPQHLLIQGNLPPGLSVKAITQTNPYTLILEIRPDIPRNRNILWLPGLRWKEEYVSLGSDRFPITSLTLSPNQTPKLNLEPIWTYSHTMEGTTPLLKMGEFCKTLAAINAGFFNRNNRLPLGAIRWHGTWYSGPILNRGAIAWDNQGSTAIDRLTLEEVITTSTGGQFPLVVLNSGYVKGGISRFTPQWGKSYTPLTAGEVIIVVENNRVTRHVENAEVTDIPDTGYLLVLRSLSSAKASLMPGTTITLESTTNPSNFNSFPHIIGGGPLLIKNQQIVVDAQAEGFSRAFAQQSAIRSVFGITNSGELILVTIHNRIGGLGASLTETAELMQKLGAIHALNLDGGSSTSLILGGQMINRPPSTAARVHNGLGIFSHHYG